MKLKLKTGIAFIDRQPRKMKRRLQRLMMSIRIVRHYAKNPPAEQDLAEAVRYVKRKGVAVFPYHREKDDGRTIEVHTDAGNGYRYVVHEDKRLYFPQCWDEKRIHRGYAALLREQEARSPHRYLTPQFDVTPQTALFDIGAAEGILSLSVIERVASVHLFEAEERWIEPLKLTFAPWKEKVRIVRKYVSDVDDKQNITLDTCAEGLDAGDILLKIDVEGHESHVLAGGRMLLGRPGVRAVVCTYHRAGDFEHLSAILSGHGFRVTHSPNYMLFLIDPEGLHAPWFRRGVIYCDKEHLSK